MGVYGALVRTIDLSACCLLAAPAEAVAADQGAGLLWRHRLHRLLDPHQLQQNRVRVLRLVTTISGVIALHILHTAADT